MNFVLTCDLFWQAMDAYLLDHQEAPMYNKIFFYMFQVEESFSKLINIETLMDPIWWVNPDCNPVEFPIYMLFFVG